MNYYKHHLGDYAKDTPHLNMLEHGAYRLLMDACYTSEKPLPLDLERVYSMVRATKPPERKAVDFVLSEFFDKSESGYIQKRIAVELEIYKAKATQNKANGNRGGRPKITQSVSESEPKNNLSHKPIANSHKNTSAGGAKISCPEGVSESIWNDFCQLRKAKKAPLTETALRGIEREATAAGMNLQSALEMACERGWQGFKAEWVGKKADAIKVDA